MFYHASSVVGWFEMIIVISMNTILFDLISHSFWFYDNFLVLCFTTPVWKICTKNLIMNSCCRNQQPFRWWVSCCVIVCLWSSTSVTSLTSVNCLVSLLLKHSEITLNFKPYWAKYRGHYLNSKPNTFIFLKCKRSSSVLLFVNPWNKYLLSYARFAFKRVSMW